MSEIEQNNIKAAMSRVVESDDFKIKQVQDGEENVVDKQVLIRVSKKDRQRWKQASEISGKTLSSWIRDILNMEAGNLLDCPHPLNEIKYYPWAQICTRCGLRINSKKK
jgi:hypothetical protein